MRINTGSGRINRNKQNKPHNIVLELTYGCNRRCPLCFKQVRDLPPGEYHFMSISTAITIAEQLKPFQPLRLQFDSRGEPFLNPNWKKIIQIFRKKLPTSQIHVISNGDLVDHELAKTYFRIGGNILSLDCYTGTFNERKQYYKTCNEYTVHIDQKDGFQPYKRNNPKTTKELILIPDNFEKNRKGLRQWNNLAGNIDFQIGKDYDMTPLEKPLLKPCTLPFKDLIIRYNGDIRLCFLDGENNKTPYGNIYRINLQDYWYNDKRLNTIRTLLYNKLRIMYPCNQCNYGVGGVFSFIPKYKKMTDKQIQQLYNKHTNIQTIKQRKTINNH